MAVTRGDYSSSYAYSLITSNARVGAITSPTESQVTSGSDVSIVYTLINSLAATSSVNVKYSATAASGPWTTCTNGAFGDGTTSLAVYTNGIFDLTDAGAGITLGNMVKLDGANAIAAADEAGAQGAAEVVGQALEAATGSEVIMVRILK